MIRFDNVSFSYDSKTIIKDFSYELKDYETLCLNGPSGTGKTTLLRLLMGLASPSSGKIETNNKTVSAVFQEDRLIEWLDVYDNIKLVCDDEKTIEDILEKMGLSNELHSRIDELSGGMKRRISLARALCHKSDLLILDEPFNGLDEDNKKICSDLIKSYGARNIVISTHDISEADLIDEDHIIINTIDIL